MTCWQLSCIGIEGVNWSIFYILVLCCFLQIIPEGDWFCPSCRPKELLLRTPRKSFTEMSSSAENSETESEDEMTPV